MRSSTSGVSSFGCITAAALLAAFAGTTAHAQWSVEILRQGTGSYFTSANAVFGNVQGGSSDDGNQRPLIWRGTADTESFLVLPSAGSSAEVTSITAAHAAGSGYYSTGDTGFYTGFLWSLSANTFTLINVPGATESEINDSSGTSQVGSARREPDYQPFPVLWQGTSESWVNLLPALAQSGTCEGVDGTTQVGSVYDGVTDTAALWRGTAESYVSLHPAGWDASEATCVSGLEQAGSVYRYDGFVSHAAVWRGTAASFVDLHPACASESEINDISRRRAVGTVREEGSSEQAAYWPDINVATVVNLHALLPGDYYSSAAHGIWTDSRGIVRIVGEAEDRNFFSSAVMWTFVGGGCVVGDTCTVVADAAACAGTFLGAGRVCGTPVVCCNAGIGSALSAQDLDGDLRVDSCTPPAPANDCNQNNIADGTETLDFTSFISGTDWSSGFTVNGAASIVDNLAELTPAEGGGQGTVVQTTPIAVQPLGRLRAIFDFKIDETVNFEGDGFSFNILDAQMNSELSWFGEDGPGPGAITVKFNTYANTVEEGSNSMYLIYNGQPVVGELTLPFTLADNQWHRVVVDLSADGRVNVNLATQPGDIMVVFEEVVLPNYVPFAQARVGFGGRTGDAINRHRIDNLRLGISNAFDANFDGVPDSCDAPPCFADFNNDGGVDGEDVTAFFVEWQAGNPSADANVDGGVDGSDVDTFFVQWVNGGC